MAGRVGGMTSLATNFKRKNSHLFTNASLERLAACLREFIREALDSSTH